jgi:hypothetical protein
VYPITKDEIPIKELGVAASLYVFSKTTFKRLFSNKSIHVKIANDTL